MPSRRRTSQNTTSGISLQHSTEGIPPRVHIHAQGGNWTITSNVPIGMELLDADLLEKTLPGALGTYILPADAVFHMTDRKITQKGDFLDRMRNEEELQYHDDECSIAIPRLNHYSVRTASDEDGIADEEYDEASDDGNDDPDDCANEEEEEDAVDGDEGVLEDDVRTTGGCGQTWESDDENDDK